MNKLDKNGFLKSNEACFIANLTSLVLNILSLGGILAAIGIEKNDPETALTTAAISLGVGAVGVATAIATEIAENKLKKLQEVEDSSYSEDEADEEEYDEENDYE